ncbi:hypothetical protein LKD70_09190 [Ruminococcus sp. CLA-AA-H200]|uniref:Chromosome partition protein Smc n=1 Tax=Ruminococcus turbiniformis TaxID=2881258 RepID=A0ABS8FYD0_9FIRM|nr:hypothetical protein [Ruminococcus turbiniformis]MCC2254589.1 hypothetical protein [Ruminococcus turbiniformis]
MTNEARVKSYKAAYAMLQKKEGLSNFKWPKDKKHLEFSCNAGNTLIQFRLFSDGDLLTLRADCDRGGNDAENNAFATEMASKIEGMISIAHDGVVVFSLNVPFPSTPDDHAQGLILEKTEQFVDFILQNIADKNGTYKEWEEVLPEKEASRNTDPEQGHRMDGADDTMALSDALSNTTMLISEDNAEKEKKQKPTKIPEKREDVVDKSIGGVQTASLGDSVSVDTHTDTSADTQISNENLELETGAGIQDHYTFQENADVSGAFGTAQSFDNVAPSSRALSFPEAEGMEMYTSLRRAFQIQMDQLDFREKLLDRKKTAVDNALVSLKSGQDEIKKVQDSMAAERQKLNNSWDNYRSAKKNLESRMEDFAKKEAAFADKEAELGEREERISSQESHTALAQKAIEYREKTVIEKEGAITKKQAQLSEKEMEIKDRESDLSLREDRINIQLEQIKREHDSVSKTLDEIKELQEMADLGIQLPSADPAEIEKLNDTVASLRMENKELREQIKDRNHMVMALQSRQEKQDERNAPDPELERRLRDAEQARSEAEENIRSMQERLSETNRELSEVKDALKEREAQLEDKDKKAKELEDKIAGLKVYEPAETVLNDAGYQVNPVVGEGDPLLSLEINGCTAYINEKLHVVCIEKATRRNYTKTFDAWNSQSFAETYGMSKGKAYCRFPYDDLVADLKRISDKLSTLK